MFFSASPRLPVKRSTCKVYFVAALPIGKFAYFTQFFIFLALVISILNSLPRGYKPCKVKVKIFSFINQDPFYKFPKTLFILFPVTKEINTPVSSPLKYSPSTTICALIPLRFIPLLFEECFGEFCIIHLLLFQLVYVVSSCVQVVSFDNCSNVLLVICYHRYINMDHRYRQVAICSARS